MGLVQGLVRISTDQVHPVQAAARRPNRACLAGQAAARPMNGTLTCGISSESPVSVTPSMASSIAATRFSDRPLGTDSRCGRQIAQRPKLGNHIVEAVLQDCLGARWRWRLPSAPA